MHDRTVSNKRETGYKNGSSNDKNRLCGHQARNLDVSDQIFSEDVNEFNSLIISGISFDNLFQLFFFRFKSCIAKLFIIDFI